MSVAVVVPTVVPDAEPAAHQMHCAVGVEEAEHYWLGLVEGEWECAARHWNASDRQFVVVAGLESPEEPVIAPEADLVAALVVDSAVEEADPAVAADLVKSTEVAAGTGRSVGCMAAEEEHTRESFDLEGEAVRMRRTTAVEADLGCARRYEQERKPESAPRLE